MDLYEAIGLLELEPFLGADNYIDYTSKDVEKCFRKQALKHHPDKGGDASHFQRLHRAKDVLLERNTKGIPFVRGIHSTAVSTSLYEHRTCVRQVLSMKIHGSDGETVIAAATDDGLIVIEPKKDTTTTTDLMSGGLKRVVSFTAAATTTTHRDDCSYLCCCCCGAAASQDSAEYLYAGTKDGSVHRVDLSTNHLTPWKLPSRERERIVAISAVHGWVAIATANGGICVLEYETASSTTTTTTPTIVWRRALASRMCCSPETILLEEGSSSECLNLWVGGSSNDGVSGKIFMWELNSEEDFYERFDDDDDDDDDLGFLFGKFGVDDSDIDSRSEEREECNDDTDDDDNYEDNWNAPAIDVTVHEGPIFSLSKHKHTIAVTSGQYIIIWHHCDHQITSNGSSNGGTKLAKLKTIRTDGGCDDANNKTLYTLCINEQFMAAAGAGESIMVWDRDTWAMLHHLPLQRSPLGCCLATNCIMTLDWCREDSGVLVSGGYDGIVTMWSVANRLADR